MRFTTYLTILITLVSSAILLRGRMKKEALVRARSNALPEVIELIISGLQSGMSISETLESLGNIGPKHVQTDFKRFAENLREGSEFQLEIEKLKDQFKDSNADQLFETLKSYTPNLELTPLYRESRMGDVRDSLADINKAKKLLNYQPTITLANGLKIALDWYKQNPDYFL